MVFVQKNTNKNWYSQTSPITHMNHFNSSRIQVWDSLSFCQWLIIDLSLGDLVSSAESITEATKKVKHYQRLWQSVIVHVVCQEKLSLNIDVTAVEITVGPFVSPSCNAHQFYLSMLSHAICYTRFVIDLDKERLQACIKMACM